MEKVKLAPTKVAALGPRTPYAPSPPALIPGAPAKNGLMVQTTSVIPWDQLFSSLKDDDLGTVYDALQKELSKRAVKV